MWAILHIIFLHSPLATQCICYIVQLVSVFLRRRSFSATRCWWPTRTTFISNICSTRFKPFHPLINLSLTHGALSILSQHTTVNFHSFTPSAQRNRTRPRCSSMVQSCKRTSMFSPSLLPLDLRQSAVLHMAELFNRHCQYCAVRQLLSVPVTV